MLPEIGHLLTSDDRLRLATSDPVALVEAVDQLRRLDGAAARTHQRRLGVALLALRRLAEAVDVLTDAAEHAASTMDYRGEVAARVNLGDAYRYGDDLDSAGQQYLRALEVARAHVPELVDFPLQHLGKWHLDAGRLAEARACLREASALRAAKGDPELLASTHAALRATENLSSAP